MDLSGIFSDDQIAIFGCFAALAVCGLIAAISFRLGPAGQQKNSQRTALPLRSGRAAETSKSQDRRAA
jgi:hypothetical protein